MKFISTPKSLSTRKVTNNYATKFVQVLYSPKTILNNLVLGSALMSAHPVLALVDDRLAGEGTGKALGINDPVLGWVIIGVFTSVWTVYYIATKELGGQREEDGLGL